MSNPSSSATSDRVAWVDVAKGICIIFVVMMHSTLGTGIAMGGEGWMHYVVAFARPFRMPDFFLISGLFLGLVIDRPWLRYIDRKVVHFFYFYVLWLTIQFAFKAPGMAMENGWANPLVEYLFAFVQPFGTLWFIYILPLFFVVTRLAKPLPKWLVFAVAALLETLPIHTGSVLIDEFAARYVYFFAGYAFATYIFDFADWMKARLARAMVYLGAWVVGNAILVFAAPPNMLTGLTKSAGVEGGIAELPLVSLALGFAGAAAIVAIASMLSSTRKAAWLSWLGAHSIVVYLAFFLPMAATRVVLVKTGIIADIGTVSLIVTVAAVIGPVVLYLMVRWSGYGSFLFERPRWATVDNRDARATAATVAAE